MFTKYLLLALIFVANMNYANLDNKSTRCFSGHPLTISEMISIALENNPHTGMAWSHAKKTAAALGIAKSAYYPQFGIEAYASHGREFRFINGPDVNYTNVGANLTLSMILFDFGRTRAIVEDAKYALIAAGWQTDWTLQKVMVNVLENAYSAYHAMDVLHAYEETLRDAENMLYTSRELHRSGIRAITDVYTTQAALSLIKMDVAQQKAKLEIHFGKLASILGYPADYPLSLAPLDKIEPVKIEEDVKALIAFAKIQRADLMAQQARQAQSWAKVKKSQADFLPKIGLRGRGGADYYIHNKANPAHYEISVNLEIPLFNGFETIYKNRYAYAEAENSEEELAQLELDIALEILTYSRSLQAAQEMLQYADENIENSLQAYLGVIEMYKAGKQGIAEVSNALRQLANSRIRYSDTHTKFLVSMANLAFATGTLVPKMEDVPCN